MSEFYIDCKFWFSFWIILTSAILRVVFSLLRANEYRYFAQNKCSDHKEMDNKKKYFATMPFGVRFCEIFKGISTIEPYPDSWYNTVIGTVELASFPVLMVLDKYAYIGAWLGFKMIGQWKMWAENRNAANRIVIATATQLLVSYFLLTQFVYL